MKREGIGSYLNIYIPRHIVDEFRAHCKRNGLVMSVTVTNMIKEYLDKQVYRG
jgi:hypothetical protein